MESDAEVWGISNSALRSLSEGSMESGDEANSEERLLWFEVGLGNRKPRRGLGSVPRD